MIVTRLLAVLLGYSFGCLPIGYLVGKIRGVDIRKHGSGNTGATNTLRTIGLGAALITFFGDSVKTILAIFLAAFLFENSGNDILIIQLYAGIGAVLGHNFPFYFKFKGGKGIACTAGTAFVLFPEVVPLCVLAFLICILVTRYVSLGSIIMVVLYLIQVFVYNYFGFLGVLESSVFEYNILSVLLGALAIFQHRENIVRLCKGTENKIGKKVEIKEKCEK